jgi:hypothetical protein
MFLAIGARDTSEKRLTLSRKMPCDLAYAHNRAVWRHQLSCILDTALPYRRNIDYQ